MRLSLHCSLLLGATITGCIAAVDGYNEVVNEVNGHNEVVELNNILKYNLFTVFSNLNIYATEFEKLHDAAHIADSTAAESSATGDPEDEQASTEVQGEDMYDLEFTTKGKSGDQEASVESDLDEMIPKEVDHGQNTHRGEDMEDGGATNNGIVAKADHYDVASDEVTRAKADAEADNSTPVESPAENVYISAEASKDNEEILNENIKANDSEEEESDQENVHDEQKGGEVEGADSDKGKVPVQHKDDAAATTNENSKLKEIESTESVETKKERNDEPLEKKKKTKVHSNSGTVIAADGRTGESAGTGRETEVSTAKHDKKSVKKKAAAEKAVKAEAERDFTEKASEAEAEKDATKKAAEAAAERSAADKAGEEKAAANKSLEVTEAGNGGLDDDVKDIVYTDSANFNKPTLAVGILSVLFAVVFC